jgi:hypothetical protein
MRGPLAPSPLSHGPGGPTGAAGRSCARASTAAVCTATDAAPLPSVPRRTVGSDPWPPGPHAHVSAGGATGLPVPHRPTRWGNRGGHCPGSTANASSQGKTPDLTRRAPRLTAFQGQGVALVGGEVALAGPAGLHRPTTGGATRSLLPAGLAEIGRPAGQGHVLQHAGATLGQPWVSRHFTLLQGRLGMR